MPSLGTLVRAQMRNGFLAAFGDPYPNLCQLPPDRAYQGQIIGIWQVPANEHEPAQIDILAVPAAIWQAFIGLTRGSDPEKILAKLQQDAVAAHASGQAAPSAMRLSFPLDDGSCGFYESSLSMPDAMVHFLDRNNIAASAYDDDDDDEDGEEETATPANGAAVQGAVAVPAPTSV